MCEEIFIVFICVNCCVNKKKELIDYCNGLFLIMILCVIGYINYNYKFSYRKYGYFWLSINK